MLKRDGHALIYMFALILGLTLSCSSSRVRYSEESPNKIVAADTTVDSVTISQSQEIAVDSSDSSFLEYSYIDDELRYQLDLAEENYKMGFAATVDSNWLEAQFYFESALEILAGLDIDPEAPILAAEIYSRLTNEIITDYKRTLLYIATLPGESSPAAVVARYEELETMTSGDTLHNKESKLEPDTVVYDIPITWNEKVKKCIMYFQSIGREPFEIALARSGRYLPMMEKIFAEEGLPHDLVYLPLIESGFNPRAYSWAHAVGPWQFISSTGHMYGLKRSWWYDERRDFEKSTRAAARHLRDLYNKHKDWYLALLGYNAGSGNVNKLIRKNKTHDYFKMRIRNSQMRNYVPLYLAAVIIAKQPEKYGFEIEYKAPIEFDTVTVGRCLALKDIANAVACSEKDLKSLNPELLRKYTPPDRKKYTLRIPTGMHDIFWSAYPRLKSPKETSWVQHKVRKGETVSGIARKYGISQYAVIDANNLRRPYRIHIGQKLVVPVPLNKSTSYSKKKKSYKITGDYYVIRRGDTLWDLARALGTTTRELRRLNNLSRNSKIFPGQKLNIPTKNKSGKSSVKVTTYKVRRGDNLWNLAKKHGTTVSKLARINGISKYTKLKAGQVLSIPVSMSSKGVLSGSNYYVVRRGDTLSAIAKNFGVSMSALIVWNNISNPHRISPGDKLRVSAQ